VIVVLKTSATDADIDSVLAMATALQLKAHLSRGVERTVIGILGVSGDKDTMMSQFAQLEAVENVVPISRQWKLVAKEARPERTIVRLANGAEFGGNAIAICAGPCSIESREQVMETARGVAASGANVLRGGAFKPRTSPYAFQGLKLDGLKLLREAADAYGLAVVTEVLDVRDVEDVAKYADMMQIGARNMQNFTLLQEVGSVHKPVLLKRGISGTIEEWLMAAEYIVSAGNHEVVLCERGIRSYDPMTRNVLDLSAIPLIKSLTHLPIVVDPSHGTGARMLVAPMALAGIAAGADGLLIEVHPNPAVALSDGPQSLTLPLFDQLMKKLDKVAQAVDRSLPKPVVVSR
jgi:3-deoxy-7-phosphoheptulonate synthase